jgi:hypothetical protein
MGKHDTYKGYRLCIGGTTWHMSHVLGLQSSLYESLRLVGAT